MDLAKNLKIESVSRLQPAPPLVLRPQDTVRDAVSLMQQKREGCVLVCVERRLVGIFTERDLLKRVLGPGKPLNLPIADFMTPHPVAVQYVVVEGKHLSDATFTGQLVKLSENRGEIHAAQEVTLWSNLRLRLPTVHDGRGADIYAKVIGYPGEDHTRFMVHFTSIPPVLTAFFLAQGQGS